MKATEQYSPVVLFIMLYKVVLSFESEDEILKYDHSNESYWAVLSCGTVYYAVQGGSKFWICGWNPKVWQFKWKLLSCSFLCCCLLCCSRTGSNFWVCERNPKVWPFNWFKLKLLNHTFLWRLFTAVQGGSIWVCAFKLKLLSCTFLWNYIKCY